MVLMTADTRFENCLVDLYQEQWLRVGGLLLGLYRGLGDAFPYIYSNGVLTGKQKTCGFPGS